ncbi:MAG: DUF2079 domain-containing protein [Patescibacteria group bacterium]|nr:DUF2079 domain-containing protein [Patescibacteria group bacterium]
MKGKHLNNLISQHGLGVVIGAVIIYVTIFAISTLTKYYQHGYNALDLAIINQVFFTSSVGHWFASSIHPPTYLGDHFSPLILILLPFYWLYRGPQTLLILQTLTLAAAAIPIYLIAKKIVGNNWAVAFAIFWLANPFVENINMFEFSLMPFAIMAIWLAIYFFESNLFLPFLAASIVALMSREDVALVIIMFGAYAWLKKRKINWRLTPILLGLGYLALAITISGVFAASHQYKFLIYYPWLGNNIPTAITNLLTKPWLPLSYLFRINNFIFLLGLLMPLFFLPLFYLPPLIIALLIFLQLFLSTSGGGDIILQTHYVSLLLPAVFLAAIYAVSNFKKNVSPNASTTLINKHWPLAVVGLTTAVIYGSITLGPMTSLAQLNTNRNDGTNKLLAAIPPQAVVAASYKMLPALASREKLYSLNYIFLGKQQFLQTAYTLPADTEYIIIDWPDLVTYQLQYGFHPFYQDQYATALKKWPSLLNGFGLLDQTATSALFQKNHFTSEHLVEKLTALPQKMTTQNIKINDELTFRGVTQTDKKMSLFWQINKPLSKIYRLEFTFSQSAKKISQLIMPWAYDLINSESESNKIIQTNYWLGAAGFASGTYDLVATLLTIDGGGIELNGLRSAQDVIDKKTVIGPELKLGSITVE